MGWNGGQYPSFHRNGQGSKGFVLMECTRRARTRRGTAGRSSTWIPPRFSSLYLSFCCLAAAAGTAGSLVLSNESQRRRRCSRAQLSPRWAVFLQMRDRAVHRRVMLLVSRSDHCLVDVLYRWGIGELPMVPTGVTSELDEAPIIDQGRGGPCARKRRGETSRADRALAIPPAEALLILLSDFAASGV
jgi:hypothetical protein